MNEAKQIIGVLAMLMLVGLVEGQTKAIDDAYPTDAYERCMSNFEGSPREPECDKIK